MTLLATNDSGVICRIQLTGEGRWVSLALSLGDRAAGNRFLVGAESLRYEMAGVDEDARHYGLSNWQGGVISGARYAFRALKTPIQQICLHELRGQLSGGDVWAISAAAALAVARLLACPPDFPLDLGGWTVEEEISSRQTAASSAPSSKVGSSQPETPRERADDRAAAVGSTAANGDVNELPVEKETI